MNKNYRDLNDYLIQHNANKIGKPPTHTRIGDKDLQVFGGAYSLESDDMAAFYKHYHNKVFVKKQPEYLTEKQLSDDRSPLAVDLDFRYSLDVTERQHTPEHNQDLVILYLEEMEKMYRFTEDTDFPVYIMEKPHVNRQEDKGVVKDGIHMIIGVQMNHVLQQILREKILEKLPDMWDDLSITNSWDSVLDEGISKGSTNWQLYGSRKPGNEAYAITQYYRVKYDSSDGQLNIDSRKTNEIDLANDLYKVSVRYTEFHKADLKPAAQEEYLRRVSNGPTRSSRPMPTGPTRAPMAGPGFRGSGDESIRLSDITNAETLEKAVNNMLAGFSLYDHKVRETHEFTQILPAKYYEPGSHLLNRKVAFGLKDTDERLFLSWVALRSKADDFDYTSIPKLYRIWSKDIKNDQHNERITRRSIMYWARHESPEEYERIRSESIDALIDETIACPSDWDFGMVLYNMFNTEYLCSNQGLEGKRVWWTFEDHHWVRDYGETIRIKISREMHGLYQNKISQYTDELRVATENQDQDAIESCKKKVLHVSQIQLRLKKTNDKNNIIKEAGTLFYDKSFNELKDTNLNLMGFTNGVVDFKNKCFREGYPQDYITKTTGIEYVPVDDVSDAKKMNEITSFMKQLFPIEDMNKYMWNHLAASLLGTNVNQTFNIYRGSGSNGKSKLIALMGATLGDYCGTVGINVLTSKRVDTGATSSEIVALKGVRYGVASEPEKGMTLNEGVMKEMTGGDKIQARGLYSASETFILQLSLCVCTNYLFEVKSNDDGTWRRIRIVDFVSKFARKEKLGEVDNEYKFEADMHLDEKIEGWAPLFASMLVKIAFENEGKVDDCDAVLESSRKYRELQDHIAGFVSEMVIKTNDPTDKVTKSELSNEFKMWFQENQGNRKPPKGVELYDYMSKLYGKWKQPGWKGVKIAYPEKQDEMEELENE